MPLLNDMIDAAVASFDGEPFTARGVARLIGEDHHKVRAILDRMATAGKVSRRLKRSPYENGISVVVYREVRREAAPRD